MAKYAEVEETLDEQVDQTVNSQKLSSKAKAQKRKELRKKVFKVLLATTIFFIVNTYIILSIMYKNENFTVTLDSEEGRERGLVIYEELANKYERTFLRSDDISAFTDISIDWIPKDIHNQAEGSHNGRGFIAYTFYAENMGQDTINYWAKIEIDDVIKNVDEAIRVMVFKNDEKVIYAKESPVTGKPEPNTQPFHDEDTVMLTENLDFKVGDIDKYTIVIWVEGDDPECKNNLIGGEIKMHMTLTEEHILQENERPQNKL